MTNEEIPSRAERRAWWTVAAWTLFISVGIFVGRFVQRTATEIWGRSSFIVVVAAGLVAGAAYAAMLLRRDHRRLPAGQAWWLGGTLAAFGTGLFILRQNPEEALHLILYGVLGYLLFRALNFRQRDWLVYPTAACWCAVIGLLDEVVQWLHPLRIFGFRDILINAVAGALMQVGVWGALRPDAARGPVSAASIRSLRRAASALFVLLLLCVSNTLERQRAWQSRLPGPAFIRSMNDLMIEYGYRYEDPVAGVFFSRLSPQQLQQADEQEGERVAALLAPYVGENGYKRFESAVSVFDEPFAYEMRVHIFRRDRHIKNTRAAAGDPDKQSHHAHIALREHQILETYFGRALSISRYHLPPSEVQYLAERAREKSVYVSAVSAHLVTGFRPWHLQGFMLAGLLTAQLVSALALRRLGRAAG